MADVVNKQLVVRLLNESIFKQNGFAGGRLHALILGTLLTLMLQGGMLQTIVQ